MFVFIDYNSIFLAGLPIYKVSSFASSHQNTTCTESYAISDFQLLKNDRPTPKKLQSPIVTSPDIFTEGIKEL